MDKDTELAQVRRTLKVQEAEIGQLQHQISEPQQKENDTKKTHKLEIVDLKSMSSNSTEEIFRLKNHNKTLVTKIKKLKNSQKVEQSTKDIEGKILDKQEENSYIRNHNEDLKEQLKNFEDDRKSQE